MLAARSKSGMAIAAKAKNPIVGCLLLGLKITNTLA
jgi:hypothetical protein